MAVLLMLCLPIVAIVIWAVATTSATARTR